MTPTPPLTPADLGKLFDQPVIVTEIDIHHPPANGAIVFWHDAEQQGVVITPLYSDADRALLARRMEQVRKRMTDRP